VWVGNFDRKPLRNSSGVTGAGPLFHAVMLAAEHRALRHDDGQDFDPFEPPSSDAGTSMHSVEICVLSGLAANAWCPARRHEWVSADAKPLPCSWHHLTDEGLLTVWPAQYRQWARDHGLERDAPPVAKPREIIAATSPASQVLRIASPPDGATYLIDPTLRRDFQALSLRVVTDTSGPVHWTVDERALATGDAERLASWPLVPGRHVFRVRDGAGQTAQAEIVVR
jgi:penicillin-binding protein 1C